MTSVTQPFLIHGRDCDAQVVYMVELIHHSLGTWVCQLAKQDVRVCARMCVFILRQGSQKKIETCIELPLFDVETLE